MKKLLLLLPLPLIALLTACQSKKEICAQHAADLYSHVEAAKRLGVDLSDLPENAYAGLERVENYCAYYKN